MTVASLTVVAGRNGHLRRLLDSLAAQVRPPDEIVVVDLADDPHVARLTSGRATLVRHDDGGVPLAIAAARNVAAAAAADHEQLLFLDVDMVAAPTAVSDYRAVLDAHPDALACGVVRYLREDWAKGGPATEADLHARSDEPVSRLPQPAGVVRRFDHERFWSLAFAVTRATWTAIGGFDESYRGYGAEDTDFAFRARTRGIPLAWFPGGTCYHQWHPPTRHDPAQLPAIVANARRFHRRWRTWPMDGWLKELAAAGLVVYDPAADRLEVAG